MTLTGQRVYVGFGFGAIQAGLFLYEAFQSGAFGRLVVAEVMPDVVATVRRADGHFTVNIAQADGIEAAQIGPLQIEDPTQPDDRERLIDAVAAAHEIGTAIPSIAYYASDRPGSLHRVLAEGLRRKVTIGGPRAVVYTAENHNHAAEVLTDHVLSVIPADERDAVRRRVRFLNTVIGKMSGVVTDAAEIEAQSLEATTPGSERAFLVETFNRILISSIDFDEPFERGLGVFAEKPDLLPFEEAKLYGHNALHATAGYLGAVRGLSHMSDLPDVPGLLPFVRTAALRESGGPLMKKYAGQDDLFTDVGFARYSDDLLRRMVNPYLRDTIDRVTRDPARKLGWDDRLIGTMRLALAYDIQPWRYGIAAAAALTQLDDATLHDQPAADARLRDIWAAGEADDATQTELLGFIHAGRERLRRWIDADFPPLDEFAAAMQQ